MINVETPTRIVSDMRGVPAIEVRLVRTASEPVPGVCFSGQIMNGPQLREFINMLEKASSHLADWGTE